MQSLADISMPVAKKLDPAEEIGKKSFRQVMDEQLAACEVKGRKKRKGSSQYTNSDPFIKFLRQGVSRLNYGEKAPACSRRPCHHSPPPAADFLESKAPTSRATSTAR